MTAKMPFDVLQELVGDLPRPKDEIVANALYDLLAKAGVPDEPGMRFVHAVAAGLGASYVEALALRLTENLEPDAREETVAAVQALTRVATSAFYAIACDELAKEDADASAS